MVKELLPSGVVGFNTRVWEVQAAKAEGKTIDEWYALPFEERNNKVAADILPTWLSDLNSRYAVARRV